MGRIEFEVVGCRACRFRDQPRGFEPVEKAIEIRRAPLTGRTNLVGLRKRFAGSRGGGLR
jgi:hypothetical protein